MPYLIDGYNLLRYIQKIDEDLNSLTEPGLCRILSEYLRRLRDHGHIYFDGIGPPDKDPFENMSDLEVIFTGRNVDADTVIENKITADSAPKRLTIVSSDRALRDAARRRKATTVKSQVFWEDVQKQLSRKRKKVEPKAKLHGLTEGETKQWLKFFGIEQ